MLILTSRPAHERGGTGDRAFMAFKLHQFISGAGHVYTTLRSTPLRKVTLDGQRFDPDDPEARLYPIFFCRNCGQEHHPVVLIQEGGKKRVLPRDIDETPLGTGLEQSAFSFFSRTIEEFQDPRRHFVLSRNDIARINPNTITAPIFRTAADAELTTSIHARVPAFIDETKGKDGNPWGVAFMAMFHMANDSGLFSTAAQLREAGFVRDANDWLAPVGTRRQGALGNAGANDGCNLALEGGSHRDRGERYVPLYEAKMIHHFDHRWQTFDFGAIGDDASRSATADEKRDPSFEHLPRYWLSRREVDEHVATRDWSRKWLLGWRDITNATNERTLISAVIPVAGCSDKFLLMFPAVAPELCACLNVCLNSLVCDYVARQKLGGTSFKYFVMKQVPVLRPSFYSDRDFAFIVPRILELTYTSHSMAPFARDLRYDGPPFKWEDDRRAQLRAELDAFYARAYGLTRDELRYIIDPADVKGAAHPSKTFRVLKTNEVRRFGEYRTARLVLQAWDRMERGELAA